MHLCQLTGLRFMNFLWRLSTAMTIGDVGTERLIILAHPVTALFLRPFVLPSLSPNLPLSRTRGPARLAGALELASSASFDTPIACFPYPAKVAPRGGLLMGCCTATVPQRRKRETGLEKRIDNRTVAQSRCEEEYDIAAEATMWSTWPWLVATVFRRQRYSETFDRMVLWSYFLRVVAVDLRVRLSRSRVAHLERLEVGQEPNAVWELLELVVTKKQLPKARKHQGCVRVDSWPRVVPSRRPFLSMPS